MPKTKERVPVELPPAPFKTGDIVRLKPGLLARYPLWKPPAQGPVERVKAQTTKQGALEVWVTWVRLGAFVHIIDSRDLEKV